MFEKVIFDLSPANDDIPLVSSLSDLTSDQLNILEEIKAEVALIINRWSICDVEVLESFKNFSPETYERLKPELYSIVENEKNCLYLDLNRAWLHVSSLFECGTSMEPSTLINKVDNFYRINIFSGKPVNPDVKLSSMRYQEVDEVLEMARSFSKIDELEIQRRFEQALEMQWSVYRYGWEEESYTGLLDYCKEVQNFYQSAATQGFGVVNAIG